MIAKAGSAAASSASVIAMITTREMCARGHPGRSNCWRHFHHRACLSSVRKRVQRARRQRIVPVPEWYRWPPPTPPGVLNTALPSPLSGCCCCGAAARGDCARHCSSGSLPLSAQLTYAAEGCLLADILLPFGALLLFVVRATYSPAPAHMMELEEKEALNAMEKFEIKTKRLVNRFKPRPTPLTVHAPQSL